MQQNINQGQRLYEKMNMIKTKRGKNLCYDIIYTEL